MERKVYMDVILNRLRHLDLGWFAQKAFTYLWLRLEGLLKTGWAPAPLACGLVVTENCNMRCPMCVLPLRYMKEPNNRDGQLWRRVIDDLHQLGMNGIAISGGEPLTRSDALDLVAYARGSRTTVTLNSNMTIMTDERIAKLLEAPPDNINVSVDSGRDEVNDQLRGGHKVLSTVLERIKALTKARDARGLKFTVTAVTALSDGNLDDLEVLFEKVAASGADRLCFIPLHDIKDGRTYIVRQSKARPDLLQYLRGLATKHGIPLENSAQYLDGFHNVMTGGLPKEKCNVGYTHMIIGADLKIYRCVPYMNMGKVLFQWDPEKATLKQLWNSPEWRKDRLEALNCKECFWDCHAEVNILIPM
jgi:MoaA/NifB/PqqE/SkfB family radical SAM enzyme